ncbi:MAG TPA: hypothetical protein VHL11_25180 [Phototrophicaceae bacterium]|jgi:hypothetical protein|nr:hypothetical protein [Phototrophicaceae bacterium]
MSDVTNPDLIRAYQLIEADDLEQARSVLDIYLENHRDNADAWWLYAHAVTDPMEAQNALRNVLRLAPNYPGAKVLLSESEQILTPARDTSGITRLASRPVATGDDPNRPPDFLDRLDDDSFDLDSNLLDDDDDFDLDDDDDFGDDFETDETPGRPGASRRLQFLMIAALIVVVLVALALVLKNVIDKPKSTPTSVVNVATSTSPAVIILSTDTPTVEIADTTATGAPGVETTAETAATDNSTATDESPVTTPDNSTDGTSDFESIYTALSAFTVVPESAIIIQTSLGSTFLISVCNDPVNGLIKTTLNAIEALATQASPLVGQADYAGVRIVDCNRNNLSLRSLAVSLADATAYAQGSLTLTQLRAQLKPITQ